VSFINAAAMRPADARANALYLLYRPSLGRLNEGYIEAPLGLGNCRRKCSYNRVLDAVRQVEPRGPLSRMALN